MQLIELNVDNTTETPYMVIRSVKSNCNIIIARLQMTLRTERIRKPRHGNYEVKSKAAFEQELLGDFFLSKICFSFRLFSIPDNLMCYLYCLILCTCQ